MRIEWASSARANLGALYEYIAEDSPQNAERFIARLFDSVEKLAVQPKIGRQVPEAEDRDDVRELIFNDYRIIYHLQSDCVYIVNVIHGSRELLRMRVKPWKVK